MPRRGLHSAEEKRGKDRRKGGEKKVNVPLRGKRASGFVPSDIVAKELRRKGLRAMRISEGETVFRERRRGEERRNVDDWPAERLRKFRLFEQQVRKKKIEFRNWNMAYAIMNLSFEEALQTEMSRLRNEKGANYPLLNAELDALLMLYMHPRYGRKAKERMIEEGIGIEREY